MKLKKSIIAKDKSEIVEITINWRPIWTHELTGQEQRERMRRHIRLIHAGLLAEFNPVDIHFK